MNKSKNGGYADYDDPDFDSEWFDDEAYDRALAQGYDEDDYDARNEAAAPVARTRAGGPPSRSRATASSIWPVAFGSIAAVLLAAGAGYYLVATFANTDVVRRVQTAYQVLRGRAASTVVTEVPREGARGETSAGSQKGVESAPSPSVPAGVGLGPLPPASGAVVVPPGDDFGPGGPVASGVEPPLPQPPASTRPVAPGAVAAARPSPPTLSTATQKPVSSVASPRVPESVPTRPPRLPASPAPKPLASAFVGGTTPAGQLAPKRLKLSFVSGVVALTGSQVEMIWTFVDSLEGRPGRYAVVGNLGYGRLAPSLAQQRVQAVAGLLRRQQFRAKRPVDVRVLNQPVQGIAARQVEIIFSPEIP